MYNLDWKTATAIEILERSIVCHPSLFKEALQNSAKEDMSYAATRNDPAIRKSVMARHHATTRAIAVIDAGKAADFANDMGAGIVALNIACKLQLIPAYVRTASALRTWESNNA